MLHWQLLWQPIWLLQQQCRRKELLPRPRHGNGHCHQLLLCISHQLEVNLWVWLLVELHRLLWCDTACQADRLLLLLKAFTRAHLLERIAWQQPSRHLLLLLLPLLLLLLPRCLLLPLWVLLLVLCARCIGGDDTGRHDSTAANRG